MMDPAQAQAQATQALSQLDAIDYAVGAIMVFYGLRGYTRGLIAEVLALGALIAAATVAFRWTPDLMPKYAEQIPGPAVSDTAITFLFVFGAVGLALRILAGVLHSAIAAASNSPFNRLGGAVFGLGKGGLTLGCMVLLVRTFAPIPAGLTGDPAASGPLDQMNRRLSESVAATTLSEIASGVFSTFVDAAEIRLRMLAASDNEGQ
jgi:membrane protein required for colicin V production